MNDELIFIWETTFNKIIDHFSTSQASGCLGIQIITGKVITFATNFRKYGRSKILYPVTCLTIICYE